MKEFIGALAVSLTLAIFWGSFIEWFATHYLSLPLWGREWLNATNVGIATFAVTFILLLWVMCAVRANDPR